MILHLNDFQAEIVRDALTICLDTDEFEEDFPEAAVEGGCEVIGMITRKFAEAKDAR